MSHKKPPIIVALDFDAQSEAEALLEKLDPNLCHIKIGKQMFTQWGPEWVKKIRALGFEVFLDLKYHDIPNTVQGACYSAARLGAWMINVHAQGGVAMLKAAKEGVKRAAEETGRKPLLIGVTILTSLSESDLPSLGLQGSIMDNVLRLAGLCQEAGLDGVVCSAQEVAPIKAKFGSQFLCITPGIRLNQQHTQDQSRVLTPREAIQSGSDYLVVGRPITQSDHPEQVLRQIIEEIPNELG